MLKLTAYLVMGVLVGLLLVGCASGPHIEQRYLAQTQGSLHTGLDLSGYLSEPVRAAQAGRVVGAGPELVEIEHADGRVTRYYHIGSVRVQRGDQVQGGQQIAQLALTGIRGYHDRRVIGRPHLHLELRDSNGRGQDPESLPMTCDGGSGWWWPVGC